MPIDLNKYKDAYLNEAKAHIKTMNFSLVELEKNPDDLKLLNKIFRSIHTLKSLSGTMRYEHTMNLCHAVEDVLDAIRHEQLTLTLSTDLLFECIDQLSLIIKTLETSDVDIDSSFLIKKLQNLLMQKTTTTTEEPKNHFQLESEAIEKIHSIDVKIEKLDNLMNLAEEFLVNKMKFESIREQIEHPELTPAIESLGRLITDFQYNVMQIRLVPISFVFNRFIRMTRDLAKKQKKEVNLQIEDSDIELDRSLIDEVAEAISHLIRNAIDHGLETPDERKKLNKPEQGTILLRVYRTKEAAKIEVTDDGRGLDLPAIKKVALKNHLVKINASEKEIVNTIFSGISTAKSVTEISGRGLGLSIVKLKMESIGGTIRAKSIAGKGTTFEIEIPLSLAIIKTLFVKADNEIYAIPTDFIERLLMVNSNDILGLLNDEAIIFEDKNIPIIRLNNLFHHKKNPHEKQPVILISKDNAKIGIAVDELLTTKEVIIKPLNRAVRDNKFFSGATLIGSGQMILILDVAYLLELRKKNESLHGGLTNAI